MQDLKTQSLISFANNPVQMEAVYEVILNNFLKEKSQHEVYIAAAERIAVDCLKKAWRELEAYKVPERKDEKPEGNVGL